MIKLGRVRFKIKDMQTEKTAARSVENLNESVDAQFIEEAISFEAVEDPEVQCRYCWSSESNLDNPLFAGCHCKGSTKYIHYQCLKQWLNQRMFSKVTETMQSFYWKSFECELCKTPYHCKYSPLRLDIMKINGMSYNFVNYETPADKNFIVLESLPFEKTSSKMIHVLSPNEEMKEFKLGRGHDSDVRVSDISVSRIHAFLAYKEGNFYL